MKRFTSMLLALTLIASCITIVSAATGGAFPMASPTITKTSASSYTGDNTGEVDIEYSITASGSASTLGASSTLPPYYRV